MTKDELKARLGSPDIIVLDVRTDRDWANSEQKIKGALRENPKAFEQWAAKYPRDKTFVLYCA
jgi:rhodanese-related sulfurtransferase